MDLKEKLAQKLAATQSSGSSSKRQITVNNTETLKKNSDSGIAA